MNTPRPVLSSNTKIVNKTTIDVEIPFPWPIGAQNLVHSEISLPDGSKENIYVWIHQPDPHHERYNDKVAPVDPGDVRFVFNKDSYRCIVVMAETITIRIEDKKIVEIQDKPLGDGIRNVHRMVNNFRGGVWSKADVYVMSYIASMGVPPFNIDQSVDLSYDDWTPEVVQMMIKLVDLGHVVNLYHIIIHAEFWTPEDVMAAGPLLSIVTGNISMKGIDLNMAQWQEIERRVVPNGIMDFTLADCTVDQNSSECVANIMANVNSADLENVKFEDIQTFCDCFEVKFQRSDVRCQRLRIIKKWEK